MNPTRTLGPARRAFAVVLGASLFSFLLAWSLLATMHSPAPRDLPVAVVAPQPVLAGLRAHIDAQAPGALDLTGYDTQALATAAIKTDDVAGAVVFGQNANGPSIHLLTAGAGGPAAANLLTEVFSGVAAAQHASLTTTDVVPLPPSDRLGVSGFLLALAAMLPAIAVGAAIGQLGRRVSGARVLLLTAAFAVVLAAANTALAVDGLGVFAGHGPAVAGFVALLAFALSLVTAAGMRLIGPAMLPLAALCVLGVGVPASGGPAGLVHFMPTVYRVLGPALPNSATVIGLRDAAYFGGHGVTTPLIGLGCWISAGLVLLSVPRLRRGGPAGGTTVDIADDASRAVQSGAVPSE
ncbi:MAG: hypothetical protein ACRDWT_19290 [Jatrophihabitantaceae bacterium]